MFSIKIEIVMFPVVEEHQQVLFFLDYGPVYDLRRVVCMWRNRSWKSGTSGLFS